MSNTHNGNIGGGNNKIYKPINHSDNYDGNSGGGGGSNIIDKERVLSYAAITADLHKTPTEIEAENKWKEFKNNITDNHKSYFYDMRDKLYNKKKALMEMFDVLPTQKKVLKAFDLIKEERNDILAKPVALSTEDKFGNKTMNIGAEHFVQRFARILYNLKQDDEILPEQMSEAEDIAVIIFSIMKTSLLHFTTVDIGVLKMNPEKILKTKLPLVMSLSFNDIMRRKFFNKYVDQVSVAAHMCRHLEDCYLGYFDMEDAKIPNVDMVNSINFIDGSGVNEDTEFENYF